MTYWANFRELVRDFAIARAVVLNEAPHFSEDQATTVACAALIIQEIRNDRSNPDS
jgi:hypothetical protein